MAKKTNKEKLQEIANMANEYHKKFQLECENAVNASSNAIEYVVLCGQALVKAKELQKHGSWKKWLSNNFDASFETAVNYMRIATEWDSSYLRESIATGLVHLSQNSILQAIRQEKQQSKTGKCIDYLTPEELAGKKRIEAWTFDLRKNVRHNFALAIKDLTHEELWMLQTDLRGIATYSIWDTFREELRKIVRKEIGYDPVALNNSHHNKNVHTSADLKKQEDFYKARYIEWEEIEVAIQKAKNKDLA